ERAAGRVEGVRPGCAVAVRLDAGHSRETFAVAVESNNWQDPACRTFDVRGIDVAAGHDDDVLDAATDDHVAFLGEVAQVAG
ncbi:hypothetical protein C6A85_12900, partial [Mycobacterium sp. ITM-2017-0098]